MCICACVCVLQQSIAISDAQMIIVCTHAYVCVCVTLYQLLSVCVCARVANILSEKIGCQDNANNLLHCQAGGAEVQARTLTLIHKSSNTHTNACMRINMRLCAWNAIECAAARS